MLKLSDNRLGDATVTALGAALLKKATHPLAVLDVSGNQVVMKPEESVKGFRMLLNRSKRLFIRMEIG